MFQLEPCLGSLILREIPSLYSLLVRVRHSVEDQRPGENDGASRAQFLMPRVGDGLVYKLERIGVCEVSLGFIGLDAMVEIGNGSIRVQNGQRNGTDQTLQW